MDSIRQTAKLNGGNPKAYLTEILSRIAADQVRASHQPQLRTDALDFPGSAKRHCRLITADTQRLPPTRSVPLSASAGGKRIAHVLCSR
jgi:transposase IS66-like protein